METTTRTLLYEGLAKCLTSEPPVSVKDEVYKISAYVDQHEIEGGPSGYSPCVEVRHTDGRYRGEISTCKEFDSPEKVLAAIKGDWLLVDKTPTQEEFDPVNHPQHYASGSLECIDWIESMLTAEEFRGYLKGNVLKYVWRHEDKGKPAQDLSKAIWYLERLKDGYSGKELN